MVGRAVRLIGEGACADGGIDGLAARLGIGPRHLHRLFVQHVGAPPVAVAQTWRLGFAKRLLDETTLPVTQVALVSGFGSIRRFNDAFRAAYERPPSQVRRRAGMVAASADRYRLTLAYRPPYDWNALIASSRRARRRASSRSTMACIDERSATTGSTARLPCASAAVTTRSR